MCLGRCTEIEFWGGISFGEDLGDGGWIIHFYIRCIYWMRDEG